MSIETSNCWYKSVCTNDCTASCIRFLEMNTLMELSNIPENRQKLQVLHAPECDYEAFCKLANIKDNIVDFVNSGRSIYIASKSTGNGKTTWAIKLMMKYFDEIWPGNGFKCRGIFIHVPTFLLKCKDFGNKDERFEELKKSLHNVDLVIWDDIASTDISAYDYSQLLMYIDIRANNGLSNIFTGNIINRASLQKAVGDKLTSRIMSNNTDIITFNGGDKR